MRKLKRVIQENKYEIVHIHQNSASMVMDAFIAKLCGVSTIVGHSHNTRCNVMWQHYFLKPFVNLFLTDRYGCSEAAGRWVFGNRSDVKIIKNAIDTEKYAFSFEIREDTRENLGIRDAFVVGYVGRLFDGQKNLFRLIDIFSSIVKLNENAVLIMVGEGPDKENLLKRIEDLKLSNKVKLLGKRDDINHLMMAMDVFVMPSYYEGLPVVIVEAQGTGLPCVISDRVPAPDLIDKLKVLSLETSNDKWAKAIMLSCNNHRLEAKMNLIDRHYDIFHEADLLQEFYLSRL